MKEEKEKAGLQDGNGQDELLQLAAIRSDQIALCSILSDLGVGVESESPSYSELRVIPKGESDS